MLHIKELAVAKVRLSTRARSRHSSVHRNVQIRRRTTSFSQTRHAGACRRVVAGMAGVSVKLGDRFESGVNRVTDKSISTLAVGLSSNAQGKVPSQLRHVSTVHTR
jgi:hypothetical protein